MFLAYELITTRGFGMLIGGRLTCGSGGNGGRVGRAGSGGRVGRGRILLPSADGRALQRKHLYFTTMIVSHKTN